MLKAKGGNPVPQIVLTEEQYRVYSESTEAVDIVAPNGHSVGRIAGPLAHETPEFIAEALRRLNAPGPRFSGEQVKRRLAALQVEWDRTGGFDRAYMREFMKKLTEADPPCINHGADAP
jgi:hypothetical protein